MKENWTITGCENERGSLVKDPTGEFFTARFPHGGRFIYRTMQKANIGRCWAAALTNVPKVNKRSKNGWADLARAIDMGQPRLTHEGKPRSSYSMSSGVSNIIYGMATRGVLPRESEKRLKLLELAGEPWVSDPDLRS